MWSVFLEHMNHDEYMHAVKRGAKRCGMAIAVLSSAQVLKTFFLFELICIHYVNIYIYIYIKYVHTCVP